MRTIRVRVLKSEPSGCATFGHRDRAAQLFPRTPAIATQLKKDEKLDEKAAKSSYTLSWNWPRFYTPFERRRRLFLNRLFLGFAKVGGGAWLRGPGRARTRDLHGRHQHPLQVGQDRPWAARGMTDDDLDAIVAWRRTVPPLE